MQVVMDDKCGQCKRKIIEHSPKEAFDCAMEQLKICRKLV